VHGQARARPHRRSLGWRGPGHGGIGSGIDFRQCRARANNLGDGPNNFERRVDIVRDEVVARGITINGLPIMNKRDAGNSRYYLADLNKYFEGCVIGGRGAFVEVAHDLKDFARAMKKKLVLEIAGLAPPARLHKAQYSLSGYPGGCDIGERMRGLPYSFDDP
jgi:hypothetical protein